MQECQIEGLKTAPMTVSQAVSREAMENALVGYLIQRDIVFRKLQHAQMATQCGLHETELMERQAPTADAKNAGEIAQIGKYSTLWMNVIDGFNNFFMTEKDLWKIENILGSLPQRIMKFYKVLIDRDIVLQGLIKEITKEKYIKAKEMIEAVQSNFCPATALCTKFFGPPPAKPAEELARENNLAYKIPVPKMRTE